MLRESRTDFARREFRAGYALLEVGAGSELIEPLVLKMLTELASAKRQYSRLLKQEKPPEGGFGGLTTL